MALQIGDAPTISIAEVKFFGRQVRVSSIIQ